MFDIQRTISRVEDQANIVLNSKFPSAADDRELSDEAWDGPASSGEGLVLL